MKESIGFVSELSLVGEFPRPSGRDQCLVTVLSALGHSLETERSPLLALIERPGQLKLYSLELSLGSDEDALNEICSSLSLFSEKESSFVSAIFSPD